MAIASVKHTPAESWLPAGAAPTIADCPAWLKQLQQEAMTQYQDLGLPGVRDEQWRYTNLRSLQSIEFNYAAKPTTETRLEGTDLPRLVFVNGHYNAELSTTSKAAEFMDLQSALQADNDLLAHNFGRALPQTQHAFTLLNTALASTGYVLILPQEVALAEALEVVFVHDCKQAIASHTRNLIIAGAHSKCTIIERHIAADANSVYLNNCVTEIIAGDGAKVDHYKLQQEADEAFHLGGVFVQQACSSEVKTHSFALSGKLLRNDLLVELRGEGAHAEMNGLVLANGQLHVDNHTEVNHTVPHCSSDQYYKAVLDDASRSVFRGRIIVAQDAQHTNADQQNNNLLLSEQAEADTKPQLEIYADDVKCSHGATVGQLDPKSLFYLQSRGIDQESAQALLTFAFANEVVERIKVESVRTQLSNLIAGELANDIGDML